MHAFRSNEASKGYSYYRLRQTKLPADSILYKYKTITQIMKSSPGLHLILLLAVLWIVGESSLNRAAEAEHNKWQTETCSAEAGCQCIRKGDQPTMLELIQLNVSSKQDPIRINDRIGAKYWDVGICLLNDKDGSTLNSIVHDYNLDKDRLTEIFRLWFQGKGQKDGAKSTTWSKLIECLNLAELKALANEIKSVLCHSGRSRKKATVVVNPEHNEQSEKAQPTTLLDDINLGMTYPSEVLDQHGHKLTADKGDLDEHRSRTLNLVDEGYVPAGDQTWIIYAIFTVGAVAVAVASCFVFVPVVSSWKNSRHRTDLDHDSVGNFTRLESVETVSTQADNQNIGHDDSIFSQTSVDSTISATTTDLYNPGCSTEQTATFKYLDVENLTEIEKDTLIARLAIDYENITGRYSKLNLHIIQSLKERSITTEELSMVLMDLHPFRVQRSNVKPLLADCIDEIESKDIDGAFRILRSYGSFFDYFVLKHIVDSHLCTDGDKRELQEYENVLKDYCQRSIFQCPSVINPTQGKHLRSFVFKVDESVFDSYEMKALNKFRVKVAGTFGLNPYTLFLRSVEEGCLQLTFQIPHFIVDILFPITTKQQLMLRNLGVARITCGDYYIDFQNPVKIKMDSDDRRDIGEEHLEQGSQQPSTPPHEPIIPLIEEFDYVEYPSEDFFCPVTTELLLDPHLTACCGSHLSQSAVFRLKREGKPCPFCREPELVTELDKSLRRRVRAVQVHCSRRSNGCEWVGEVGELKQHIQSCSIPLSVPARYKMASLETPAVSTMITHSEELIMTFSSDPEVITGVLFSTGFIHDDVLLKLASDDTPNGKAALLVEAVTKEIELTPERFTELLKILSENFLAINVVDGLLATYKCYQEQSEDSPSTQALSVPAERVLSERDIATLLNLIHNFSDKWNEIGMGLGFAPSELKQIGSNPSLFMSAPASFLATLLCQWVQWPTKDHPTKPTLGALCEALCSSLVGLKSLAEQVERELKCSATKMLQVSSAVQSSPSHPQSPGRSKQTLSVPAERVLSERDIATLLNLIHNFSNKWNEIGMGLGFASSELKEISNNPSLLMSAPASFLTTLLSQWVQWPTRDHPTRPTLGALCEALHSSLVGLGSLAEQVERELKCSTTEMLQVSSAVQSSSSRPQSPGRSTQSIEMVRSNVEKIKALFSALLLQVQAALQSQQSDVSNVRQFLKTFFKYDFPQTSDMKELFDVTTIHNLWTYQHYSPLERLIIHFLPGDQELEGLMRAYKARLSGFYLTTKLIDYIEHQNWSADDFDEECDQPSPKLTTKEYRKIKVVLQLERKISQVSLDYVVKLWQSFAEEYEIPSLTAVIDRIVAG